MCNKLLHNASSKGLSKKDRLLNCGYSVKYGYYIINSCAKKYISKLRGIFMNNNYDTDESLFSGTDRNDHLQYYYYTETEKKNEDDHDDDGDDEDEEDDDEDEEDEYDDYEDDDDYEE